jgi:hypothetical protein
MTKRYTPTAADTAAMIAAQDDLNAKRNQNDTAATVPTILWNRHRAGTYGASMPINGEAGAFEAFAVRDGDTWCLSVYAYDRPLAPARWFDTLTAARAAAQSDYDVVEGVNL